MLFRRVGTHRLYHIRDQEGNHLLLQAETKQGEVYSSALIPFPANVENVVRFDRGIQCDLNRMETREMMDFVESANTLCNFLFKVLVCVFAILMVVSAIVSMATENVYIMTK
ncbi:MAG: hypothetical protein FD118_4284 [Rhodocyclaceae bacterium]|nr:MAG: hypothetical protein FD118_4284 [Rhodocyclaceae bacterium]